MRIFLRRLWHISKRGFLLAAFIASLPLVLPPLSIAAFIGCTVLFHLCCGALVFAFLRGLLSPSSGRSGRKSDPPPAPIEVRAFLRVPPSCSIGFVEGFAVGLSQSRQLQRLEESSVDEVVDEFSETSSVVGGFGSPNSWQSFDLSPVELNRETNVGVGEKNPQCTGADGSFSSILEVDYAEPTDQLVQKVLEEQGLEDCCSAVKGSLIDEDYQARIPSPKPSWCRDKDGEAPTIGEMEAKECMKVVEFCLAQAAGFGVDDDFDDDDFAREQVEEDDEDFADDISFPGRSDILLEPSEVLEKLAKDQSSPAVDKLLVADQRQRRLFTIVSDDDSPRPSSSLTSIHGSSSTSGTSSSSLWSSNDKSSSTPTSSASSVNNNSDNSYSTPPADTLGYGRRLFEPAAMSLPAKATRRRPRHLDGSSSSSSSSSNTNDCFCDTDPALSRFAQLLRFWRSKEREMDSISRGRRKDLFGRSNNQQCPS